MKHGYIISSQNDAINSMTAVTIVYNDNIFSDNVLRTTVIIAYYGKQWSTMQSLSETMV